MSQNRTHQPLNPSAEAGQRGPEIRSDCWVRIIPQDSGGLQIALQSKVESMYGDSIRVQAAEVLRELGLPHGQVEIEDSGALPFVIAARIETAARRTGVHAGPGCLPDQPSHALRSTERERPRRSRLYLPGNEPKFMLNAGLHAPDAVILDLEDSVAPQEKDAARILVRNALRTVDFGRAERMVRINQGARGLEDLEYLAGHNVDVLLIPKVESADDVRRIDQRIRELQPSEASDVYLMPIIESALGALRAFDIAGASERIVALSIGLEDYTADLGTARTPEGRESFWARCQVVNAARAAGVQPIDSVFSDVDDAEGLRHAALQSKALGFDGMGCIHPRQIAVIHQAFAPTAEERAKAAQIVEAFERAQREGLGVVALGSKMIDAPVVKRAQRVLNMSRAEDSSRH